MTQMFAPSNAIHPGLLPTENVPSVFPSLARSLVTVPLATFETHTLAPSKVTPYGCTPTGNVPSTWPSAALNLVTVLSLKFAVQMLGLDCGASPKARGGRWS